MRYAVIMAGGAGKRLWPLSRQNRPKQLLKIVGGRSLMEIAVQRLDGLFEPEHIYVVTNAEYADRVAEVLPDLPRENIIGEPEGRDTAAAIALAAAVVGGKDPGATMAVFTADHVIRPVDCFCNTIDGAMDLAEANPEALLTLGVRPVWPHTGLGYIEAGEGVGEDAFRVNCFVEKPDHATARQYVEDDSHYWNSGMFIWTVKAIDQAVGSLLPDTFAKLEAVREAAAEGECFTSTLRDVYPTLEKISIDYAVMEKAANVMMVVLNCEWIDMGSWPALESVVEPDTQGNAIVAQNHILMDSFRNVIVSSDEHLLAVLGVDDCIVIHSEDATLVCRRDDSQRLKELVAAVGKHYGQTYL
ncbi:MAG: NTP transferase domain-containing protein [Planctomycetes bacterium]|jgi:mannose-1-phosphate guanylyltransferase|nr:NTP transferase domain-containing protein [Planctomycetota bacterium]